MTEKRKYEKPSQRVIKLQHTGVLMTSGQVNASMDGVWDEETI